MSTRTTASSTRSTPSSAAPSADGPTRAWSIRVADRTSGEERRLTVEARSAAEAEGMIDRERWLVGRADPLSSDLMAPAVAGPVQIVFDPVSAKAAASAIAWSVGLGTVKAVLIGTTIIVFLLILLASILESLAYAPRS